MGGPRWNLDVDLLPLDREGQAEHRVGRARELGNLRRAISRQQLRLRTKVGGAVLERRTHEQRPAAEPCLVRYAVPLRHDLEQVVAAAE